MNGILYGVGVGPGDPELMTVKALRIIKECDVIAVLGENPGTSAAFGIAKAAYPPIMQKLLLEIKTPMTKEKEKLEKGYTLAADEVEKQLILGRRIAVLTLGDPAIYSSFIYLHRKIKERGYESQMISGVPSFCAAAARLGDSLADREMQLHLIPASYQQKEALALNGTKVFMKAGSKFGELRQQLSESGCEAVMVENCGMENERVYRTREDFPEKAGYYTIVMVK